MDFFSRVDTVSACMVVSYRVLAKSCSHGKEGGMAITKKDIVLKISNDTGIKQIDVKRVVQSALDRITEYLASGQTVELRNFGIFKIKSRRGRLGRNPRTGQEVPVPPKKVVVFKPGLIMKRDVK